MPTRTAAPPLALALLPALLLPAAPARAQAETSPPLVFNAASGLYYDPATGYTYGPTLNLPYLPNPGGAYVISNSTVYHVTDNDTPVAVADHTYATTVDALLSGQGIFQMSFDLPYSDPAVQAAVAQADSALTAAGASPSAPALASSLLTDLGSVTTYAETGSQISRPTETSSDTFGPATILVPNANPIIFAPPPIPTYYPPGFVFLSPPAAYSNPVYDFYVLAGQLDTNVQTDYSVVVDRTVTTTTTDLLTQTYDITGTPRAAPAVPEPSPLALLALGLPMLGLLRARRKNPS